MCIFTLIGAHTVIYLDLLWMVGQFFHLFSTSIWYVVTALSSFLVLSILLTWQDDYLSTVSSWLASQLQSQSPEDIQYSNGVLKKTKLIQLIQMSRLNNLSV